MKYFSCILLLSVTICSTHLVAQDSTGLKGTPYQETQAASYLLPDWYPGSIRMEDDHVYDGVQMRYDLTKDEVEYKNESGLFRVSEGIKEFSIPSGVDLYLFRSGFPAVDNYTTKSFYRIVYDGETKLLKKYQSPIKIEKASATRDLNPDAKLYILKDNQLHPVSLNDRNSFLKLLKEERNKMNYIIRESNLDFAASDDLAMLLEEYDSYKAGRGGN